MNLRERLQLRAIINMIVGVVETLFKLFVKAQEKFGPKPKVDNPVKPNRPRPLKKVVDTIDNIIPLPWRDKNE